MALFGKTTPHQEQLDEIAKADTVAFGGVGIAGSLLPATQAYFTLEEALPVYRDALKPRLEKLLRTATPAGRIYAAELLNHDDATVGQEAWHRLEGQSDDVTLFRGCVMSRTTVGGYVADRVEQH